MRRRQTAAIVITVGHRSTLQSRVTVAVGYGGLPPCLDRFQAGGLGYMTKMSLCRVNPTFTVCPVKCREVTVKKKRVETFRNIRYGDCTAALVGLRPNNFFYNYTGFFFTVTSRHFTGHSAHAGFTRQSSVLVLVCNLIETRK